MVRAVQDLDDELKTTTAIAKRVIPHMAQWKVPLTPENYHLWFEYSIGSNEGLTCEINEIIVSKKPFTSEVNKALYLAKDSGRNNVKCEGDLQCRSLRV
jgi:PleD family two-component response regulator